jgi:hypothetical protein
MTRNDYIEPDRLEDNEREDSRAAKHIPGNLTSCNEGNKSYKNNSLLPFRSFARVADETTKVEFQPRSLNWICVDSCARRQQAQFILLYRCSTATKKISFDEGRMKNSEEEDGGIGRLVSRILEVTGYGSDDSLLRETKG